MSDTDTDTDGTDEAAVNDAEKQTYQLQDNVGAVVRSGLVLSSDETIEAYPDILKEHGDVLEPVDETDATTESGE